MRLVLFSTSRHDVPIMPFRARNARSAFGRGGALLHAAKCISAWWQQQHRVSLHSVVPCRGGVSAEGGVVAPAAILRAGPVPLSSDVVPCAAWEISWLSM